MLAFWKNLSRFKKILLVVGLVAVGGVVARAAYQPPPEYETVIAKKQTLKQTVEATGKIESVSDIDLRFEVPGTLAVIAVKEGNTVVSGTLLANLRLSDLNAAVAQASANLQQKLAGATSEDITYYRAAMASAEAAANQAAVDADNSVKTAEAALATAENNLKRAEGGEGSQIVNQAYANGVAALQAALPKLDDALTQADNILGIDNMLANDAFETELSTLDVSRKPIANDAYRTAKTAVALAKQGTLPLTSFSAHPDIDAAFIVVENALVKTITALSAVSDVLRVTPPAGGLTQSTLDTKKTAIETIRASATAQYTAVLAEREDIADAKNSLSGYLITYEKAKNDLAKAKEDAVNSVTIKRAAFEQAKANYESRIKPPREVDVAAYRAALAQAVANRDKAVIRAPIEGVVSKIHKKVGESVSSVDTVIRLLSPHYEIKVDIPETDVPKLQINDLVVITLDAFGPDVKFSGTIVAIDPGSTEVQDVVYYQVRISLDETTEPIKAGMTANVTIATAEKENVITIPLRVVRTKNDGTKYARVLVNGKEEERTVTLGIRGDAGVVEVLSGIAEGDTVIVGIKETK